MLEERIKKKKNSNIIPYVIVSILAIILAGVASFNLYLALLPPIKDLRDFKPNLVTQFVSNDGEIIKTFSAYKTVNVPYNKIPLKMKQAIVATEDKNFYKHRGFDLVALVRSVLVNVVTRRPAQGASTLTQQLARILFLSNEKTIERKIKELVISHRIEKSLTKDEILGLYLNTVYLGEGAYGAGAAAEIYFGKKLNELTIGEMAMIAGLPQAPSAYSPFRRKHLAIKRRVTVLKRMKRLGFINKKEYKKALNEPIVLNETHSRTSLNKAPYFIDYAMKELEDLGFTERQISRGGYKITTTLNYKGQKSAQEAAKKYMAMYKLTAPSEQIALLSIDATSGKILAYMGGKDYWASQFDRVTQSIRQPGSSFKMFVYAAAIQAGKSPNELYDDLPLRIGRWSPRNYGNKYRMQLPLHTALALSSNVVAIRLLRDVGMDNVIKMARSLGITTPINKDLTMALGSSGVRMYEIVKAYSALANAGIQSKPYSIDKVETSSGKILYQAKPQFKKVLDPYVAATMTAMLRRVVENGTGRGARIEDRPIAGKTGTTDSYRDAWFVAYTPEVVTGVWVGNDQIIKTTKRVTGGSCPARIWKQYMTTVLSSMPKTEFNYPDIRLERSTLPPPIKLKSGDDLMEEIQEEIDEYNEQNKSLLKKLLGQPNEGAIQLDEDGNPIINDKPPVPTAVDDKEDLLKTKEQNEGDPNKEPVYPVRSPKFSIPSDFLKPTSPSVFRMN